MSLKNRGLLKLRSCISSIVVVKDDQNDKFLRVFDEFLSSHGNKYKTDRILQKLYSMIDSTVILQKNRNSYDFHKRKVKLDETNYLKLVKKIGEGSYGQIHLCNLNNKQMVIKNPIFKKKNEKTEINNNFLRENLIHIVLHCCHELMNECFKISTVSRCIPKITDLAIATDKNEKEERLISVMEKLDMDGWKFFRISDEKEQLSVLSELCHLLSCLQQSCGFTHGDLHLGNIMFSMFSNTYRPYIIDLGMACADLSLCCNANPLYVTNSNYPNHEHCGNKSHDLRRLLFCIFQNTEQLRLSNKLSEYVLELFSPSGFRPNGLFSPTDPYGKLFDNKVPHQNIFYQSVSDIDDSRFYPENVLSDLTRLMS